MAGILFPTLALPVMLTVYVVVRLYLQVPVPIERALVFPMALIPACWGLWNVLWVATQERTGLSVGVHGAILPFLILPCGAWIGSWVGVFALHAEGVYWFGVCTVAYTWVVPIFLAVVAGYYLIWKYLVDFLNRMLGIA